MSNSLVYVLIVILSLKTIVNVAKTSDDDKNNHTSAAVDSIKNSLDQLPNDKKNSSYNGSLTTQNIGHSGGSNELNPSMFTEGGRVDKTLNTDPNSTLTLSRNRNRNFEKQMVAEANKTSSSPSALNPTSHDVISIDNVTVSSSSPAPSTTTFLPTTTLKTKIDKTLNNSTIAGSSNVSINDNSTSSTTPISTTTVTTTEAPKSTPSTQKHKKPVLTKSADDDPTILDNEKKIKFINEKTEQITPRMSSDTDRTIDEEKRARHSYALFMGVAFGLPMTFVLVHILYRKIKTYMEVRHYQRVVS